MVTTAEQRLLDRFRDSEMAPAGDWWYGFPLGFGLESRNIREADAICVAPQSSNQPTPRSEVEVNAESREWFREQRQSNWLEGERVTIVEAKTTGGTWRALGQLIVYREIFETDWNATVADLIIVADEDVPGEDSELLFEDQLEEADLYLYNGEEFR